jgi:hypothetical protein
MHITTPKTYLLVRLGLAALLAGLFYNTPSAGAQEVPPPSLAARLTENQVHGYQWPSGALVTLSVDDPGTGPGSDYTAQQPVDGDPNQTVVFFNLPDFFPLQPGYLVSLTDGATTKTHTVTNLAITAIDPDTDVVAGNAFPGANVNVNIWAMPGASRNELADAAGAWVASFSQPGDEPWESPFDILPGAQGEACESDSDGDFTCVSWRVLNPWFEADPAGERVFASGWPAETGVALTIDDDPDPNNGVLFSNYAETDAWGDAKFDFEYEFDLQAGHVVTLTGGGFTKVTSVTGLQMRGADHQSDVIWGLAAPGSQVYLELENPNLQQEAWTNSSGVWLVGVDILMGTQGIAWQADDDGDRTRVDLSMPYSLMIVMEDNHYVAIPMWPGQRPWPRPTPFNFTLTIDDPNTPQNPDYIDTRLVTSTEEHVEFQLEGRFPIKRGHIVTVNDDVPNDMVTKGHVIPDLRITGVDLDNDVVGGQADPDAEVEIWVCERVHYNCEDDQVSPDASGAWQVDFSGDFDLVSTSWVRVSQGDPDGDNTFTSWPSVPRITALTAPLEPVQVGAAVEVSADFSDHGVNDTLRATWDWGDGTASEGSVHFDAGYGAVTGSHVYETPGLYTLQLAVADQGDATDTATLQYVVVYDPKGGFVTGGGWIHSPAGAYVADPDLAGWASFGFVAKYKRRVEVPYGQTEFQLRAGHLNFHSTSYQWLVVAGAKAIFRGEGRVNGRGDYGFMLTAVDAKLTPGADVDMFRIKIWDKNAGDAVIYDNQLGAADDAEPTTAIGGGSIVIHKAK